MTVSITGRKPTDRAGHYAKPLASHLSRKLDAGYDASAGYGTVRREGAVANLAATPSTLEIAITAPDIDLLLPLMGIVQHHLEGFDSKESLTCAWDDPELYAIYQGRRDSTRGTRA